MNKSSKPHLFETEIFCNMTNVFPTTFDQFNVSLLNKSIDSFKKKKSSWPQMSERLNHYFYDT